MPEIYFGKDNRVIGCSIYGHQSIDFEETLDKDPLEDEYDGLDMQNPRDILETWYVAGIKIPELVGIDLPIGDEFNEFKTVPRWKIWYAQEYARRKEKGYRLNTKSHCYPNG